MLEDFGGKGVKVVQTGDVGAGVLGSDLSRPVPRSKYMAPTHSNELSEERDALCWLFHPHLAGNLEGVLGKSSDRMIVLRFLRARRRRRHCRRLAVVEVLQGGVLRPLCEDEALGSEGGTSTLLCESYCGGACTTGAPEKCQCIARDGVAREGGLATDAMVVVVAVEAGCGVAGEMDGLVNGSSRRQQEGLLVLWMSYKGREKLHTGQERLDGGGGGGTQMECSPWTGRRRHDELGNQRRIELPDC